MQCIAAWIEAEQGRFFLLLPVGMAAAVLAYFDLKTEPPLLLGISLTTLSSIALIAGWRWPPARWLAAFALAASLGFTRAELRTAAMPPLLDVPFGAISVSGIISSIDDLPTGCRVTLASAVLNDGSILPRAIRVKLSPHDLTSITPGDAIIMRAILFKPERPAYPGGWDATRDAFFQGLGASGFELGTLSITQPASHRGLDVELRQLRETIAANINATLPPELASIAVTLLTGLQNQMPPEERQEFISAGLAHLLAVAGLHVGIVMGLFYGTVRFALTRFERTALHLPAKSIAAVSALAAGAFYALLTGAHLPILRSLAMASLVTAGVIAGRRAISLRGLALAAMVIMLATPEAVIGVSFQMSFSAVLALISGYAALAGWRGLMHEHHSPASRVAAHIVALFFTSLFAGAASMPFAAYQFGQIQPYWILANLAAVPITAFWVMPAGILALCLMPLHLSALALIPMGWGLNVILALCHTVSAWPDAMLRVPPMPAEAILCYSAGLAWLCVWRTRIRLIGFPLIASAFIVYGAARTPDILISSDARLIAAKSGHGVLLYRAPKASSFTLNQWRQIWPNNSIDNLDPGSCNNNICTLTPGAALLLSANSPCPPASVILSPEPLHGTCSKSLSLVIDRLTVYQQGAMAIWLTGQRGAQFQSDYSVQGTRPWVPPWPSE